MAFTDLTVAQVQRNKFEYELFFEVKSLFAGNDLSGKALSAYRSYLIAQEGASLETFLDGGTAKFECSLVDRDPATGTMLVLDEEITNRRLMTYAPCRVRMRVWLVPSSVAMRNHRAFNVAGAFSTTAADQSLSIRTTGVTLTAHSAVGLSGEGLFVRVDPGLASGSILATTGAGPTLFTLAAGESLYLVSNGLVWVETAAFEEEILFRGYVMPKRAEDSSLKIEAYGVENRLNTKTFPFEFEARTTGRILVDQMLVRLLDPAEGYDSYGTAYAQTSTTTSTAIVDSGANFAGDGVIVGATVHNLSDHSWAIVTVVGTTTMTTTALSNGINNIYTNGDVLDVRNASEAGIYTVGAPVILMGANTAASRNRLFAFAQHNWTNLQASINANLASTLTPGEYMYAITALFTNDADGVERETFPGFLYVLDGDDVPLAINSMTVGADEEIVLGWDEPIVSGIGETCTGFRIYRTYYETGNYWHSFWPSKLTDSALVGTRIAEIPNTGGFQTYTDDGDVATIDTEPPFQRRAMQVNDVRLSRAYEHDGVLYAWTGSDKRYWEIDPNKHQFFPNDGVLKLIPTQAELQAQILLDFKTRGWENDAIITGLSDDTDGWYLENTRFYDEHSWITIAGVIQAENDTGKMGNLNTIVKHILTSNEGLEDAVTPSFENSEVAQMSNKLFLVSDETTWQPIAMNMLDFHERDGNVAQGLELIKQKMPAWRLWFAPHLDSWISKIPRQKVAGEEDIAVKVRAENGFRYDIDPLQFKNRIIVKVKQERPRDIAATAGIMEILTDHGTGNGYGYQTEVVSFTKHGRMGYDGAKKITNQDLISNRFIVDGDPNTGVRWRTLPSDNGSLFVGTGRTPFGQPTHNRLHAKFQEAGYDFWDTLILDLSNDGTFFTGLPGDRGESFSNLNNGRGYNITKVKLRSVWSVNIGASNEGRSTTTGWEILGLRDEDVDNQNAPMDPPLSGIPDETDPDYATSFWNLSLWRRLGPGAKVQKIKTQPPEEWVFEDIAMKDVRWLLIRQKAFKDTAADGFDPCVGLLDIQVYEEFETSVSADISEPWFAEFWRDEFMAQGMSSGDATTAAAALVLRMQTQVYGPSFDDKEGIGYLTEIIDASDQLNELEGLGLARDTLIDRVLQYPFVSWSGSFQPVRIGETAKITNVVRNITVYCRVNRVRHSFNSGGITTEFDGQDFSVNPLAPTQA